MTPADFAQIIAAVVIASGLFQTGAQVLLFMVAWGSLIKRPEDAPETRLWRQFSPVAPSISLLAPAYNEETTIVESIRSLLALHYPNFEVVVINDGSSDGTLEQLIKSFELRPTERRIGDTVHHARIRGVYTAVHQPRLIVVDKVNGGKADALNAGLNAARSNLVCSMDADSLLEPDALLHAVAPFVEDSERVIAVGGTVRAVNGCRIAHGRVTDYRLPHHPLALMQAVEYLRAFLMARLAFARLNMLMLISGAFGLFQREAVMAVGGYSHGTVGEDMELVIKLHRRFGPEGKRITFAPDAVCWTEVPEDLTTLSRQRARWHRGCLEVFARHGRIALDPRHGTLGMIGMPYILIADVFGPLVELLGYGLLVSFWILGWLDLDWVLALYLLTFAMGTLVSMGSIALEERRLQRFPTTTGMIRAALAAVVENFGYRQLNLIWRLHGTWQAIRREQGWGKQRRRGFKATVEPAARTG